MVRGAAVVDENMAYFMNYAGETLLYDLSIQRWSELPKCSYMFSSLVIIRGLLKLLVEVKVVGIFAINCLVS